MEDLHWEDAIDIDDSDLPSFLPNPIIPSKDPNIYKTTLPFLQPCSQSHNPNPDNKSTASRTIPGPAGAVQVGMHRKASAFAAVTGVCSPRLRIEEEEEEDGDFKLNPWLFAAAFLGEDFELMWPICLIKNRKSAGAADRIPQVVGIVKSCIPNGLGDLFITLKDPTGIIGASIHRNVLECNLGGNISVGCVLIMKQVAVFCPSRSTCYVNITANNMVKLISKDCGPPEKQMMLSSEPRYVASAGKQVEVGQNQVEKLNSLRQNEEAGNELSRETNNKRILDFRKTGCTESLPYNVTMKNSNIVSQSSLRTNISTMIAAKFNKTSIATNMVDKPDLEINTVANVVFKPDPRVNSNIAESMVSTSNVGINSTSDDTTNMDTEFDTRKKEPEKIISSVSANQWTDEQLLELFADYQDDFN